MRNYLTLGSTPAEEKCAQVGADDYNERQPRETRAYIHQLQRQFPNPPEGVRFRGRAFPHDFGSYHEVVVSFDSDIEEHVRFAYDVEDALPGEWDDAAKEELSAGAPSFIPLFKAE